MTMIMMAQASTVRAITMVIDAKMMNKMTMLIIMMIMMMTGMNCHLKRVLASVGLSSSLVPPSSRGITSI